MRPLPVADKWSKKSFAAIKIFEMMKCDKNFGYCTADGRCLLQDTRLVPLVKGGCNKLQFLLITPLTFVKPPRLRIGGFVLGCF